MRKKKSLDVTLNLGCLNLDQFYEFNDVCVRLFGINLELKVIPLLKPKTKRKKPKLGTDV